MKRDILVSVMGDDVFSRNWMSLLLARDWRTRIVSEITSEEDFRIFKNEHIQKVDFLLIDLDSYWDNPSFLTSINHETGSSSNVKVIGVSTSANHRFFTKLYPSCLSGYLQKDEISSSLGWAVTFASEGNFVLTPSTDEAAIRVNYEIPPRHMILHSRTISGLTERQSEIARLAIIFSLGRRDLADELKVSDQWSYGMVSELYEKLGLDELINRESDPSLYLESDPVIKSHIEEIFSELGQSKKPRDLETLAFHLLTMPSIE